MSEERPAAIEAVAHAVREAQALARAMTAEDCRLVTAAEGWPAVIVAYHIGLGLRRQAGFIARALTAEAPFVFEWEPTHEMNAVNAREHASLSATEAADEIVEGWSRLGAVLGRMGEADWAREVFEYDGRARSADVVLRRIVLPHVSAHLASLRAVLGERRARA